ncbi:Zn-dependent protease with chaperone function [Motilibacter peucedani]|uniref:Zn-dependent protease with chaperone function n=1 Tax=Motilibacter peucedani TaxID=598650 RepID=A0A420XV21_9ACTN|nr:M48 family metallopeptidase [Motilibacter peucedani]RKS80678.1 Zn-dependent protease with chaperone function [Motilibacter peucedani]
MTATSTPLCPECSAQLPDDPRFVVWCRACDWNVEPRPSRPEPVGRLQRRRAALATSLGDALFEQTRRATVDAAALRPRLGLARAAAVALAVPVHGLTVAVAGAAVLAAVAVDRRPLGLAVAAFLLLLAWFVRPRLGRLRTGPDTVAHSEAPALFAVLDAIAGVVGGRPVEVVQVDGQWNASRAALGLRRRELVTLGAPLWAALPAQSRVALLGHELAHGANGDLHDLAVVGGALTTLEAWAELLLPQRRTTTDRWHADWSEQTFWRLGGWPLYAAVRAYAGMLELVLLRSSQRAEYYADVLAVQVAGSAAAADLLEVLELDRTTLDALDRAVRRGDRHGLWALARRHLRELPDSERERLRRVCERAGHAVDATHPPTGLRRRLALALALPPTVTVPDEAWAAADAELAAAMERAERAYAERVSLVR